jgi:hypothetical protein
METVLWVAFCLLLAPVGWYFWPLLFKATASGEFQPSLVARVQDVLDPHTGATLSPPVLSDVQRQVDIVVRDTLVDLHREFDDLVVSVRNDDLGPACFIVVNGEPALPLAEFEARLRT